MEVLKNFVTEKTPESENASHEIHDEDTRKVNQEWRNSNFGLKTNHVPKIDMRKFDGKDPITWILQMEQFFDLHNVPHTQKVRIASLYLEPNQFVWYRWLCSRKSLVTWTIFTEEMIAHYEDTRSNTFFSQLINLKQKGSVTEHIENFQRLNIKVTDIPDEHLIDVFIGTLKDNIQHEVRLWEPKSLENAFKVARNVESKNMAMATRRTNPNIYRENNAPSSKTPQPTRLTPQQLEERKAKGLCFNCDSKYSKGHKCGEKKLFYIDCEEEEEQEQEPSQDENVEAISSEELTPTISCNALAGISTPQTLKIEGYIKKKKVIVLIDSGSTHNFIHYKLAKDLNCFVYPAPEFQVMIADGGTINCSGKCNKINLTMGEYVMNSPMIAIPMGGADVVLGIQWLQSLGTVAFNFQELFMKFSLEGKEIELRGITGKPGKVISSNGMTKLLKKGHQGIIAQLCSLDVQTSKPSIPQDLQRIIDKHSKVFEDIPKGLPPTRNHDHEIHLIPGSVPPNIRPYRYPYAQKSEIEQLVEEMLEAGIIRPSQSWNVMPREMELVLLQEGRPLAFESRPLKGNLHKPIYEKEMMAILHALKKWHPYLIGRHFKVKTDHDSLKYFLEQRLSSEEQQKWVTKILGYDFEIVYKKGKQNVVADALSRKDEDVEAFLCAISIIQPDWIIEARDEWKNDEKVWTLIQRLQQDSSASDTFTWKNDSLWYKDRLYLCKNSQLKQKVLLELHTSPVGGHSGFLKTYHRVKKDFFWDGLKTDVQRFVAECLVCQQNKVETIKTPGLLQPLSIPSQRWEEVSMDFITGLPKSEGKSVIMVIVDRLTKYAHFCALSHPFKASTVATAFMETVQKLHGSPKIIVSDRDPIFTGHFWTELFSCLGTQLAHSSSYHPQSDGQTEIVNKCLEGYLRCFVSDKQTQWFKWLPLAEWWYNTSFHTATKMTPFMALYGYHPPSITSSLKEKSKVQAVEDHIENQQQVLQILKDNLTMAQNRMKQQADQHRSERSFEVGDWVFLRLQPYKQMSLKQAKKDNKLSPKYYGPYKVLQKIGTMAYKLELPASSRVHPVFHVSCLKKVIGDKIPVQTILPELDEEGKIILEPEAITDTRIRQLRNRSISEYLIKWRKLPAEDSTWEDESFIQKHPELLKHCRQHLSQGEGHVKP
jgi:transposase InsO family protein